MMHATIRVLNCTGVHEEKRKRSHTYDVGIKTKLRVAGCDFPFFVVVEHAFFSFFLNLVLAYNPCLGLKNKWGIDFFCSRTLE